MSTMKQPRKDVLREQLALAADEIIRLRGRELQAAAGLRAIAADLKANMDHRWWHRFAWWRK